MNEFLLPSQVSYLQKRALPKQFFYILYPNYHTHICENCPVLKQDLFQKQFPVMTKTRPYNAPWLWAVTPRILLEHITRGNLSLSGSLCLSYLIFLFTVFYNSCSSSLRISPINWALSHTVTLGRLVISARSLVIRPDSMVAMVACSSLSAKASRSARPSS